MTLRRISVLGGVFAIFAGLPAAAVDITIPDTLANNYFNTNGSDRGDGSPVTSGANSNGPDQEWLEVELGAAHGPQWDLRGFDITNPSPGNYSLAAFAGFDLNGATEGYKLGDIFIDLNGSARWGSSARSFTGTGTTGMNWSNGTGLAGVADNNTTTGDWGWDAVIHFTSRTSAGLTSLAYEVVTLDSASILKRTTDFAGTSFDDKAGPWVYVSGGTQIATGTASLVDYATSANPGTTSSGPSGNLLDGTGLKGNVLSIDLPSQLVAYAGSNWTGSALFHLTLECGNDMMMGRLTEKPTTFSLPDGGGTAALLGAGLAGLALVRRRIA